MIQEARHSFNHEDQSVHNEEIMNYVDKALTKHFTYLLYQYSCATTSDTESAQKHFTVNPAISVDGSCILRLELALTCDALESIYRASSEVVGLSFHRLGPELLHLLISLVQQEIQHRKELLEAATNFTEQT